MWRMKKPRVCVGKLGAIQGSLLTKFNIVESVVPDDDTRWFRKDHGPEDIEILGLCYTLSMIKGH